MAHVRRKFVDVFKSQGLPVPEEAIKRIAKLYAVEKEARGHSLEERLAIRQEKPNRCLMISKHGWARNCQRFPASQN